MLESYHNAPKTNPNEALGRIHALRGTLSAMGRNDYEFPRLKEIEAALKNGDMKPEAVMKELDSIEDAKSRGDYN